MNVLNPKAGLFFLAFFPGFLWLPDHYTVLQFYILGSLFMIQAFVIFSAIAFMSGTISSVLRESKSIGVVFKWIQIIVFLVLPCIF